MKYGILDVTGAFIRLDIMKGGPSQSQRCSL